MCASCGQRQARFWGYTILGPVTLRVTPLCGPCFEAETAVDEAEGVDSNDEADLTPEEVEDRLMALGPIDWTVLAPQLPSPEVTVEVPAADLAFVADTVRRIAAHHGQPLPHDIAAFVARHGSSFPPAT